jgi:hypothetical protein
MDQQSSGKQWHFFILTHVLNQMQPQKGLTTVTIFAQDYRAFFHRRGEVNFDVLITLTVPLSCVVFERSTTSVGFCLPYGAGKRGMRNPNKSTISY